jgi:hypothetical protein
MNLHEFDPGFMISDLVGNLAQADQFMKDRARLFLPDIEATRVVGTESMLVLSIGKKALKILLNFFRIVSEITPVPGAPTRREHTDQDSCADYLAEKTESLSVEKHGTPHYHL